MRTKAEVEAQFLGKYVRVEDTTRHNCGRLKSDGFDGCLGWCGPDDVFGGSGLVEYVIEAVDEEGATPVPTLVFDEGYGYDVTDTVSVRVVEPPT